MKLIFIVNNQSISISPTQEDIEIVADSKNYLIAKFIFQTKDWKDERPKYALFSHKGKTYKKYLGIEEGLGPDECYVSPEVIKEGGFTVAVFSEERITTHTIHIPVRASGYTEQIENQKATPSVMAQMNDMMYRYADLCNQIYEECKKMKEEMGGEK